jgi:signal transduction histidine kinase
VDGRRRRGTDCALTSLVPLAPTAGLDHLDGLVDHAAAAGLTIRLEEHGRKVPLPTNVDLAAHRIIQEALTNTVRHSGASAAVVRIAYDERAVTVEVEDHGRPGKPVRAPAPGNGIIGMTERACALGGRLEAGPQTDGGFRVKAWLPLASAAP